MQESHFAMGQSPSSSSMAENGQHPGGNNNNDNNSNRRQLPQSENIQSLIGYARDNYQENPTESLSCLLQALKINGGQASADSALNRLRDELGDDIATHVGDYNGRMERAVSVVEALLNDENTFLYQQGNQEFLRMSMEDGSSVVCSRCNDVVSSTRWQQHQQHWCRAVQDEEAEEEEQEGTAMDVAME
jgi:hypothetical protein